MLKNFLLGLFLIASVGLETHAAESVNKGERIAKRNATRICQCKRLMSFFEAGKEREEKITARSGIVNKQAMYNVTNNILIVEEYLQKKFEAKGIDTNIDCPGKHTNEDTVACLGPAINFRAGLNENGEPL